MLSTYNLRQKGQSHERSKILGTKLVGPFKILQLIGKVFYRLEISEVWKIRNVFHICLLKEYHTDERFTKSAPNDVVGKCTHIHIQAIVGKKLEKKWAPVISSQMDSGQAMMMKFGSLKIDLLQLLQKMPLEG